MIVIGVPTTGAIPTRVVGAIESVLLCRKGVVPYYVEGSLVYDARAHILNYALEQNADLLFLDSDIIFPLEGFDSLVNRNVDIVSGLYYGRKAGSPPIAYKSIRPTNILRHSERTEIDHIEPFMEVAGVGLGFCLIKNRVMQKIAKPGKNPFEPFGDLGEDLSFFVRCRRKGIKCMLDTTFELRHIGQYEYTSKDYKG